MGRCCCYPAGLIGSTRGGLLAAQPSSWVAEWIGKREALLLADRLGVPQAALHWPIADNLSACQGATGWRPSQSPWINELRALFAEHGPELLQGTVFTCHGGGWSSMHPALLAPSLPWNIPCQLPSPHSMEIAPSRPGGILLGLGRYVLMGSTLRSGLVLPPACTQTPFFFVSSVPCSLPWMGQPPLVFMRPHARCCPV